MRSSLGLLLGIALVANAAWWLHSGSATRAQPPEAGAAAGDEPSGPSLAGRMGELQRFTHKLLLSVDAGNMEAAEFYSHELEESAELIQAEFETYDGYPIADLTASMLTPVIERMEEGDAVTREAIRQLIEACNQCHAATAHGFIRIVERTDNPYLQEF